MTKLKTECPECGKVITKKKIKKIAVLAEIDHHCSCCDEILETENKICILKR